MMGGDGETTWNNGPGVSIRSPPARQGARPIAPKRRNQLTHPARLTRCGVDGATPSSSNLRKSLTEVTCVRGLPLADVFYGAGKSG